jgi:Tfp pilus assembly protein PilF
LLCSQGRFGEGAAAFQAAIAQDPPYRDHVLLAEKLRRAGRPREGEAVLRAAIRREPSFNRAYHALVQHYLQLGDPVGAEEALLLWKQALPADPVRAEAAADIERARRSGSLKARAPLDRR